jgi:hypothetical protein
LHVDYVDNVEPDDSYRRFERELNLEQRLFFYHFLFHMKRRVMLDVLVRSHVRAAMAESWMPSQICLQFDGAALQK